MRPFSLSGRLGLCASYVAQDSRLADIGTDHALLPIALASQGRTQFALACDIAEGPLQSARENIRKYAVESKVEARLSDGLKNVRGDEIDTVVIAGMGGELIAKILSDCPYIRDRSYALILQPMTRYEKLTAWLMESGFEIEKQQAVSEGEKRYTVMLARFTGKAVTPAPLECYLGKLDGNDPQDRAFLLHTLSRLKKQAAGDEQARLTAEKLEEYLR